jgi:hypothetical protein
MIARRNPINIWMSGPSRLIMFEVTYPIQHSPVRRVTRPVHYLFMSKKPAYGIVAHFFMSRTDTMNHSPDRFPDQYLAGLSLYFLTIKYR